MKKQLLLSAATLLISVSTSAFTVDDICWREGKTPAYEMAQGDYRYYSLPTMHGANVYFEKLNNSTIRIHNLLERLEYLDFTLDGNKLTLVGGRGVQVYDNKQQSYVYVYPGYVDGPYRANLTPSYPWYFNEIKAGSLTATVSQEKDKPIRILFDQAILLKTSRYSTSPSQSDILFQGEQLSGFTPNGRIKDTVTDYAGNTINRDYEIQFDVKPDNSMEVVNFCNTGNAIKSYIANGGAHYDPTKVTGQLYERQGNTRRFKINAGYITASLSADPYVDNFTDGWGYSPNNITIIQQYLGVDNGSSSSPADIEGTMYYGDGVSHDTAIHPWTAKDGGTRNTKTDIITCRFDEPQYVMVSPDYRSAGLRSYIIQTVTTSEFTLNGEDVTLEADVIKESMSDDSNALTVSGRIETVKNGNYVDNYELYLVCGEYESVANDDNFIHSEKGHQNAICLTPFEATQPQSRANGTADREFSVTIPNEELYKIDPKSTGKYTIYAKANYAPEHNLTPTFHDLTLVNSDYITAIEGVYTDDVNTEVEYFNLQGVRVAEPEQGGIYLRRCGSKVEKVVIR